MRSDSASDRSLPGGRRRHSIRTRLFIAFSLVFTFMLALLTVTGIWGIPFTGFTGRQGSAIAEAFRGLDDLANTKKEQLQLVIKERGKDLALLARNDMLRAHLARLRAARGGMGKGAPEALHKEGSYLALSNYLQTIADTSGGCQELFLVDAADGTILVALDPRAEGGNLANEAILAGALATKDTYIGDVEVCRREGRPALPLGRVIMDIAAETLEDKPTAAGVVILELDPEKLFRPILHTGHGLGATGEALLVNHECQPLTSLRYPAAGGGPVKVLEHRLETEAARRAARGEEGVIEAQDYRGRAVLAATRFIPMTPDWGWGLVVKRDRSELLAPVYRETAISLLIGLASICVAVSLTVVLSETLTRSIGALSRAAERVADGDLSARAPVDGTDEIGRLAATFNGMAEKVQNWHRELEDLVSTRTAELARRSEELRSEKEFVENLIHTAQAVVVLLDTDGRIRRVNRYLETLTGRRSAEVEGRSWFETFLPQREQGRVRGVFEDAKEDASARGVVNAIVAGDGRERVIEWYNTTVKDKYGRVAGVLAIGYDITERLHAEEQLRESEEKYRVLFEQSTDGMLLVDGETFIDCNEAAVRMLGLPSRDDVLQRHPWDLSPELQPEGRGSVEKAREVMEIAYRRGSHRFEWDHRGADGQVMPIEVSLTVIPFGGRRLLHATWRDISERKRTEQELARHREKLEELIRERTGQLQEAQQELIRRERLAALGQLVATIGHELRNPLGTIRTSFFAIAEQVGGQPPGVDRTLERIKRNIERCDLIIEELLDYARSPVLQRAPTPVDAWLTGVLGEHALPPGISLERHLESKATLPLDQERFRRCVVNLLTNAQQAIRESRGRDGADGHIVVRTAVANGHWELVVTDDGAGIPPDRLNRVFEPLYSTRTFGVGLGLSVVRQIMEQHGGGVRLESQVGRGTTATLWLPLTEEGRTRS